MSFLENVERLMAKSGSASSGGQAGKEVGMARAASKKAELVQIARRIAREMAVNGPVTIEDVCDRMAEQNYPVWSGSKESPQNWKGSVFATPEFVCIGSLPSRKEVSHGRHVRLWALESWLRDHPMNGNRGTVSAFSCIEIYNEYMHAHPGAHAQDLLWKIGEERLNEILRSAVSKGVLFGINVKVVNGIGAVLGRKE